jgi:hypothetical protein
MQVVTPWIQLYPFQFEGKKWFTVDSLREKLADDAILGPMLTVIAEILTSIYDV